MTIFEGRADLGLGFIGEYVIGIRPDHQAKLEENEWLNIATITNQSQGIAFLSGGNMRETYPTFIALNAGFQKVEQEDLYFRPMGSLLDTGIQVVGFAVPSKTDPDVITTIGMGVFDYTLKGDTSYTYSLFIIDENSVFWDTDPDEFGNREALLKCLKDYDINAVWTSDAQKSVRMLAKALSDTYIREVLNATD